MHDIPEPLILLCIDNSFSSKSKKWSKFPVTKNIVTSSRTAKFRRLAQSYPNESLEGFKLNEMKISKLVAVHRYYHLILS